MRHLFSLLILIIGLQGYSQSTRTISGIVTNQHTGEPLSFATIGVLGSPYGTVSNPDGEFIFYLPSSYSKDTLSISHVGFSTFKEAIETIKSPLIVSLKESITVLDEVQVNSDTLTPGHIMTLAINKLEDNYSADPFIIKGFYRDLRDQNHETVYLAEAAVEIQDRGFGPQKELAKKFSLKSVRASKSRVNNLLWGSLLNSGNSLTVNLEYNFWLRRLQELIVEDDFIIEDIRVKNDRLFYVIKAEKTTAKLGLAEKYKDMKFRLVHKYTVDTETYAIHKVEHLEYPIESKYVGIERPYSGDSLFYSKKGWNQVIEFEEYKGKMYLKYNDVNYAFDIVDEKNDEIYIDMSCQFTFITTEIVDDKTMKPEGMKMSRNKPLILQMEYDKEFWDDPGNAKLVPLTKKQISDLERFEPLELQFESKKRRLKKPKASQ